MHYFRNSCGMYISRLIGILVLCLGFNLYSKAQAQPVTDTMKAPQLVQVQFVDRVYFREKTLLEMMNHPMDAPLQPQLLDRDVKTMEIIAPGLLKRSSVLDWKVIVAN